MPKPPDQSTPARQRACFFALLALVASAIGCTGNNRPGPTALRLAVTDVEGLEQLQTEFGAFRDLLVRRTGLEFEFYPVASRTAAVEALAHGSLDLVLTGPAEYVMFKQRTPVAPVIALTRPNYHAVVVVLDEHPARGLADLHGEKIAMGPIGSTSKHLAPAALFNEAGVSTDDYSAFHTSVHAGWEALQRGDVAALATTSDKHALLAARPGKPVRVLARSEQLPSDVLLSGEGFPPAAADAIRAAIAADADEFADAILSGEDNQKYAGMRFETRVSDSDYDPVRAMFDTAGIEQFGLATGARP